MKPKKLYMIAIFFTIILINVETLKIKNLIGEKLNNKNRVQEKQIYNTSLLEPVEISDI